MILMPTIQMVQFVLLKEPQEVWELRLRIMGYGKNIDLLMKNLI